MASKRQKYVHERSGTYYYIRRIPQAVQPLVGTDRWDFSLETKDVRVAENAARARAVEHDQLIHAVKGMPEVERLKIAVTLREQALARAIMAANVQVKPGAPPSKAMATAVQVNSSLVDARVALENARNILVPDGAGLARKIEQQSVDIHFVRLRLEMLRFVQKGNESPPLTSEHRTVLFQMTGDPDGYAKLMDSLTTRQLIDRIRADEETVEHHEREQRKHNEIAASLGVKVRRSVSADDPSNPRILTALDQWLEREKQRHDTARKYRAHVRRLVESVGNIPMRSLRKSDVIRFVDELETMPNATHLKAEDRALPLKRLIEKRNAWLAANPDGYWPLISNASVRKHLESVKAFCGWYASRQDEMTNVAREVKPPKDKREKDEYEVRAFTDDELTAVMDAARALWGADGEMTWLVRIAALTGARLEELSQMARANVVEVNGVLCFMIDRGKFEEDGKPFRRQIKNDASERIVPVHSQLLEAGFLKFAKGASVRLFPSFKRSAGRYGHNPSKAFHRLLRDQLGLTDRRVRFHSLRHTMITALHKARVHPTYVNAIVGHERAKGAAGGYIGDMDAAGLRDELEKVRLPV